MSLSILFGTTSMLAVTMTFERRNRSFERLLLAPLDLNFLMLAKTSGAILFGLVNAFVPVLFASFLTDLSSIQWLPVLGAVFLIAVTSTLLGLFIAVSVKEIFEAQTFSNFFRFPMIFLCGLFIPLQTLPLFLQPLSYILPLTYGADILKSSINQNGHHGLLVNFMILLGFSVALFALSMHNVKRKWIY
jgi:ABC-2 type transport system permease protein